MFFFREYASSNVSCNIVIHSYCEWVIEICSIRLTDGVSCHNAFALYLDSTNLGIGALLRSSAVTSVTC